MSLSVTVLHPETELLVADLIKDLEKPVQYIIVSSGCWSIPLQNLGKNFLTMIFLYGVRFLLPAVCRIPWRN